MTCRCLVAALLVAVLHGRSSAQAVVEDKGALAATLSHDFGFADTIVESGGAEYPDVYVRSQITTVSAEYVPIDKLAVAVAVPLIGTKYDKEASGAAYDPHGPYDDGSYHFTLQDLRADVRYMVLGSPYALTFNAGATVPLADYPVQGSAAPGRHLLQGRIGVATSIAPSFLPRAFLNLGYELTLSQKFNHSADTKKFSQTRSDVTANAGYFVTDKFGVYLMMAMRAQHDGVNFVDYNMLTQDQKTYHDPILKEMAVLLGPGAMYQINDKVFVSASYVHFITGRNTLTTNFINVSVGWDVL